MKKPVSLLLGLHSHQPIDNFDSVVEHAIDTCYEPFFTTLKNFPDFKVSVHFSGWLLEFIEERRETLFHTLQELAKSDTLEFLTGGFYEPVLCAIPSKDRKRQIKKLSKYIKKSFGQDPKGLWLTERVWESSIITDLVSCGVEYVMVDDYHFLQSGIKKEDLYGYYHTENGGDLLKLFPINETLRYLLPFKTVDEICNYITSLADERSTKSAIIFDDGEKFGMWPGTYEWVYEKQWLESFFQTVLDNPNIIPQTYSNYIVNNPPEGFVYLQENSYMEMGEWSLSPSEGVGFKEAKSSNKHGRFIKGGIWKQFFKKYDESNRIHKRVLNLSKNALPSKRYKEALMKAQCNDALWHGVFGGLYLPNLRDTVYKYIYQCEEMECITEDTKLEDINLDGFLEGKLVSDELIALFDSKHGGQMIEFGARDLLYNFQNTLTRRFESYHDSFVVRDDLDSLDSSVVTKDGVETIHTDEHFITSKQKEYLIYDWYIKNSFVDHISDSEFSLESFVGCNFREYGDFANQPFEVEKDNRKIIFTRAGGVYKDGVEFPTTVKKSFTLKNSAVDFSLALASQCEEKLTYICEFNLHFPQYEDVTILENAVTENIALEDMREITLKDSFQNKEISISFDRNFTFYSFPLFSVSQSEKGVDLTLQGVSMAFVFDFGKEIKLDGSLRVV